MGIEMGPQPEGHRAVRRAPIDAPAEPPVQQPVRRRRIGVEVWLVLGLSLGQSAVYSVVSLIDKFTRGPISEQTSTLISPQSPRPYLDLTYQLLGIGFALVPVALALFFLTVSGRNALQAIGIDAKSPWRDLGFGVGLAALIGLPGIGLYLIGRTLGITVNVVPSALAAYWWTIPVLVLAAVQNSLLEEVVMVGYLMTRLRDLGWQRPAIILSSAALRGSYHLYQGIGPGLGNFVMGLIFGYLFQRTGRIGPLIVAHTLLDIVAFVGYALFQDVLGLG
ncbi:MAG: CPBP family intramembrane metalloprotease [Actinomycetota bacterium]|nr:CPBP family intramembrane metalloprotease [Actinomycetota bacterium]